MTARKALSVLVTFLFLLWYLTRHCKEPLILQRPCLNISKLSQLKATLAQCSKTVVTLMDQLFEVELASTPLQYSNPGFVRKVHEWFGNDSRVLNDFRNQEILTVHNKWTRQTSSFNCVRGNRPKKATIECSSSDDEKKSITKDCDFCNGFVADNSMAIENGDEDRVIVADSAFKLQDHNALFIFKEHDPRGLVIEDFLALFAKARSWFDAVTRKTGRSCPLMVWDALPASGASQSHAHVHGFLGDDKSLGHFRNLYEGGKWYTQSNGHSYFRDYANIHVAIGLGIRFGENVVLSPLDAVKDHELLLIGPVMDAHFITLFYLMYLTLVEELGAPAWSSAMSWQGESNYCDCNVLRIALRKNRDVTSMELFMFNSISSNPYETIEAFRRRAYDSFWQEANP